VLTVLLGQVVVGSNEFTIENPKMSEARPTLDANAGCHVPFTSSTAAASTWV
jgi:hypothetical protein